MGSLDCQTEVAAEGGRGHRKWLIRCRTEPCRGLDATGVAFGKVGADGAAGGAESSDPRARPGGRAWILIDKGERHTADLLFAPIV